MQPAKEQITSRITKKGQATIPAIIRELLEVQPGDRVIFQVEGDRVFLQKASSIDWEYLHSVSETMSEWMCPEDEEAFRDL